MIKNKLGKFVIINAYCTSDCYIHKMRNNVRTIGLLKQSKSEAARAHYLSKLLVILQEIIPLEKLFCF